MKKALLVLSLLLVSSLVFAPPIPPPGGSSVTSIVQFLGTSTVRGINNEIWVAVRTDGKTGSGTAEDPLNAGGANPTAQAIAFDGIMTSFAGSSNILFHLSAGSFYTNGGNGGFSVGWHAGDGWQFIGSGEDVTIINQQTILDNTAQTVGANGVIVGGYNCRAENLTVYANYAALQVAHPGYLHSTNFAIQFKSGVIRNCHITGVGGDGNAETFGCGFLQNGAVTIQQPIYCLVDGVLFDHVEGGYVTAIMANASYTANHTDTVPFGNTAIFRHCVVNGAGISGSGDAPFTDGVTNTTTTFTSATAAFTASDAGRVIISTGNIPSNTTIQSVTNATTVILSQAATTTGSSKSFVILNRLLTGSTLGVAYQITGYQNGLVDSCTCTQVGHGFYHDEEQDTNLKIVNCSFVSSNGAISLIGTFGADRVVIDNCTIEGRGNAINTNGVTNGTTTFTSATAAFVAADVGKFIVSFGNIPAGTIIQSVTNGTTVVLSQAAITSALGLTFTIQDRVGVGDSPAIATDSATHVLISNNTITSGGTFWHPIQTNSDATTTDIFGNRVSLNTGTVLRAGNLVGRFYNNRFIDGTAYSLLPDNYPVTPATLGGTGLSSSPGVGDILYGGGSLAYVRLAGPTSSSMFVLTETGSGIVAQAPVFTPTTGTGNILRATGAATLPTSNRVTAQSAANASIDTLTVGGADASYEVCMNMNVTVATAISTSMQCTYTDEANVSRTMIFPSTSLSGAFLAGGLVTATGAFETPVMRIRCKAGSVITLLTAAGTFTGVTYTAEGSIQPR